MSGIFMNTYTEYKKDRRDRKKTNWAIYNKISKKMLLPSLSRLTNCLCAHFMAFNNFSACLLSFPPPVPLLIHYYSVNDVSHHSLTLHRNGCEDINQETTLPSA